MRKLQEALGCYITISGKATKRSKGDRTTKTMLIGVKWEQDAVADHLWIKGDRTGLVQATGLVEMYTRLDGTQDYCLNNLTFTNY